MTEAGWTQLMVDWLHSMTDTPRPSVWRSMIEPSTEPATITVAELNRAMDRLQAEGSTVHGTPDRPHLFHPRVLTGGDGYCLECGILYADLYPKEPRP